MWLWYGRFFTNFVFFLANLNSCRVATVPGNSGNPGKTGFLKILPVKPWEEYTFQDDVPGKSGKNYSVIIT